MVIRRIAAALVVGVAPTACSPIEGSRALPAGGAFVTAAARPEAARFKTIFAFGASDGLGPSGALIALHGRLYGVTAGGGKYGYGVVFSLTPGGTETVVYNFKSDGRSPNGSLLALEGVLYGATQRGGAHAHGTIFALRTDGTKLWSYDFKGGFDGGAPAGGLTQYKGAFYGVTSSTFFKITRSGQETPLRAFTGDDRGGNPNGNLVALHDALFGTANDGGRANGSPGIAMRLSAAGGEAVLHEFGKRGDGRNPSGGLLLLGGTFYGTTANGGKYDAGTLYSITRDGREHAIHDFGSGADGRNPACRLTAYGGKIYGTTPFGGLYNRGTIFEASPAGKERTLYTFTGYSDGGVPAAGLVLMGATLYGTTTSGPSSHPYGTVFALTP